MAPAGSRGDRDTALGPVPFETVPLSAVFGAEIRGLDLSAAADDAVLAALRRAWLEHSVLLVRGQRIDDDTLVHLSRRFGEIEMPPPMDYGVPYLADHPEVMVVSNVVENGRPLGSLGSGEAVWHSDLNFMEEPPAASLLYALEAPPSGGETGFACMIAAFEELPAALEP